MTRNSLTTAKVSITAIDNYALHGIKQAAASGARRKGTIIGSAIGGSVGAVIGGAIGYIGAFFLWGKARDKVVDAIINDD